MSAFSLFDPQNDKVLHTLIQNTLDVHIPKRSVCPGHSAPFSFIADSYFQRANNCLVIGPRTGGKTFSAAVLEWMESVKHDKCESCHLGAIMAQAKRAYAYISRWAALYANELSIKSSTREKTEFGNGSLIEIVPGTINGVNSPHPHKASIDEFELLKGEIFQEAISMPKSSEKLKAALRLLTTRKYPNGNAQTMIDEADKRNFRLYHWCIFEVMKPCHKKSCKECEKYVTFNAVGERFCWKDICDGKAKNSDGYIEIADVISKFLTLNWETFDAQWLCNRPERSNSVFNEFTYATHVIPSWTFDPQLPALRGWDFGFDDPTVVIFAQRDDTGNLYVFDEIQHSGYLIVDVGQEVRDKSDLLTPPENWKDWGDPSGKARTGVDGHSYIAKLATLDINIESKFSRIIDGIQTVKKKLRRSSFTGQPQCFITQKCAKLINALEMAQWDRTKGDNLHSNEKYKHDIYSHPLDALRYLLHGEFDEEKISWGLD